MYQIFLNCGDCSSPSGLTLVAKDTKTSNKGSFNYLHPYFGYIIYMSSGIHFTSFETGIIFIAKGDRNIL